MTKSKTATPPPLSGWRSRSLHEIACPSGQRLRIKVPGVATLLEHGDLPDDLIELALLELTQPGGATVALAGELTAENGNREKALERIRAYGAFQRRLVCEAVQEVETKDGWENVSLTLDDLVDMPEDDVAMVAEIGLRLRFRDAEGVRIGVAPIDDWTRFRQAHECPDQNCEGCQKLIEAASSARLGEV